MDEKDMKAQALLERISELTTQYENKVADLRVQLTVLSQEVDTLRQFAHDHADNVDDAPEFIQGELVDDDQE